MADDSSQGSALGGLVNGLFTTTNNFLSNYFGKKASKKEYQRALDLWNIQNEYNKPVNQMARLREAGLNPNLVAGSLSSSAAGAVHAPSKEDLRSPLDNLDLVGSYQDIRQKDAQVQNVRAQTDLVRMQAKLLRQEVKEHDDNGTSRATPYPVKLAKEGANIARSVSEPVSRSLNNIDLIAKPFDYVDELLIKRNNLKKNRGGTEFYDFVPGTKVPKDWIKKR